MGRTHSTKISYEELQKEKGCACINCGDIETIHYHHVIPLSIGGNDIISNIVPLCYKCHGLLHSEKMFK